MEFVTYLFICITNQKLKLTIHLEKAGSWTNYPHLLWPNGKQLCTLEKFFQHYFKSALQDKITKLNSKYIPDWGTINFVLWTLGGVNTLDSGSLLDNLGDLRSNCELSINVLFDLEVIISFYIRASIYQRFQFQISNQISKKINFDNKTSSLLPIFLVSSTQHNDRRHKSRRFKGKFTCRLALQANKNI